MIWVENKYYIAKLIPVNFMSSSKLFVMKNTRLWYLILGLGLFITSSVFSYSQETMNAYLRAFQNGITTQNSIDKANVEWWLTRQAMAKMIVNFSKNILNKTQIRVNDEADCKFEDEKDITKELVSSVKEACELWLMGQWVKKFEPKETLSKAQFWTILSRVLWWDTYDWWTPYYLKHLNALKEAWIMNNIDNPEEKEVRWNVMIMFMRWENLIKDFSKWDSQKKNATTTKTELKEGNWIIWNKSTWTLTVKGKKKTIIIMDKNLWAKEVWVWESSIWYLYVWWVNQWFYFDDSKNKTWFLMTKEWTWKSGTRWPCPKWYHIPTKAEWQTVIDIWKENNPKAKWLIGKKFSEDLFLPAVWTRQEAAWRAEGNTELWAPHQAYYWTSSSAAAKSWSNSTGASHIYLSFDTKPIFWWSWAPTVWTAIANGNLEVAIRCFSWDPSAPWSISNDLKDKEDTISPKFNFYF